MRFTQTLIVIAVNSGVATGLFAVESVQTSPAEHANALPNDVVTPELPRWRESGTPRRSRHRVCYAGVFASRSFHRRPG